MPLKNGQLTPPERAFAQAMAETGDPETAARRAGIKHASTNGYKLLARPGVQDEIAAQHRQILFSDILPLATAAHKRILTDPKTPAGALTQAIKLAYDRTLGTAEADTGKELHEMTLPEVNAFLGNLERLREMVGSPLIEGEATDVTQGPEPGVFE